MQIPQRSHYAGILSAAEIGTTVIANGWIDSNRDLGGLLFFDLRDRSGILQCVIEPSPATQFLYEEGKRMRSEFVVSVSGVLRKRSNPNPKIPTGEVELVVESLTILNEADVPPF